MKIPVIYIRDKQAFSKSADGALVLVGKPTELAREWKKKGVKLIHIVDLDAERGNETNFDIYDHLTYQINIQVEGAATERMIGRLLGINARVVVPLPFGSDLSGFSGKKRLLVGRIKKDYPGSSEEIEVPVSDVILYADDKKNLERFKKSDKRLIIDLSDFGTPTGTKPPRSIFGLLITQDAL